MNNLKTYDNYDEFVKGKYLISDISDDLRRQLLFRFENGYGASVIHFNDRWVEYYYGWEMAVVKWEGDKYHLCYDTPITDDVIGDLTIDKIVPILNDIKNLKGE